MRDDKAYLNDILESIERIEKYAIKGRAAYDADELLQIGTFTTSKLLVRRLGRSATA